MRSASSKAASSTGLLWLSLFTPNRKIHDSGIDVLASFFERNHETQQTIGRLLECGTARVGLQIRSELGELGHRLRVPANRIGMLNAIRIYPKTGVLSGGADGRRGAQAAGW